MKLVIFVFFLFEAVVESDNSLFGASYTSILCEILLFQLTTSQILVWLISRGQIIPAAEAENCKSQTLDYPWTQPKTLLSSHLWNISLLYRFLKNCLSWTIMEAITCVLCRRASTRHVSRTVSALSRVLEQARTERIPLNPRPSLTSAEPEPASTTKSHHGCSSSYCIKGPRHDNTEHSYTKGGND